MNKSGLCVHCVGRTRATSVREDTLQCAECRVWKPDEEFPHRSNQISRRGRHAVCRGCQAEVRRRNRHANRVPCSECGAPTAPPGPERKSPSDRPPLCRSCWHKSPYPHRLGKARVST